MWPDTYEYLVLPARIFESQHTAIIWLVVTSLIMLIGPVVGVIVAFHFFGKAKKNVNRRTIHLAKQEQKPEKKAA